MVLKALICLQVEVIACKISRGVLEKKWNFQELPLKAAQSPLLGSSVVPRGVAHFYRIALAMNIDSSRISNTNLETLVQ